ncbi:glycosyltransferase family 4 protein [Desulfobacula sp.]|uniref:glycosyltransferase family 4 protein n=1 Tax=Desulfobacula sp. TaxID=2593537 RepID=UPI001EC350AC|nr:glycosyltransferase family 4 protein [Desulfobacula sp.]
MAINRKILFFVTEDWYFFSHRLHIAEALKEDGFEVILLTRVHQHKKIIENQGIRVIPIDLKRESRNLFQEIKTIFKVAGVYKKEKPHLVHHVAAKPILYGSIAARVASIPLYVNAFAGLGFVFLQKKELKSILVRWIFILAYRFIFHSKAAYAIFQNPEDKCLFESLKIVKKNRSTLIRGSGVDISHYRFFKEPEGRVTILLGARMLWDKGIGELVQAVKILQEKKIIFRVLLAGIPDPANPNSVDGQTLQKWHNQGIIEWIGYQEDMAQVLSRVHIATLPSYGEGVPKFLIEAAACGRPIVTTDVPGCREIVHHNKNGILVPVRNYYALADSLLKLIKDSELREKMGACGRAMVIKSFSEKIVAEKTMAFYKTIWNKKVWR